MILNTQNPALKKKIMSRSSGLSLDETKRAAPIRAPNARPTSVEPPSLVTEAIDENKSGEPLPNAKRVTPYLKVKD